MIRASYEEMQSASAEMIKIANEYKVNVDSLYKIVDNLVNNWEGIDNRSYAATVNRYKELLKSLGDTIIQYGQFLKAAAEKIRETQEDVSSAAGRL